MGRLKRFSVDDNQVRVWCQLLIVSWLLTTTEVALSFAALCPKSFPGCHRVIVLCPESSSSPGIRTGRWTAVWW
jgi:hypothetical protein